ncbi:hypothetical protein [Algoriphagus antarcticus]|uniref:Uncharacterized protein n=1 Tax=Algoriphagus antarcticus TaxID=238540 RepID=A0A3E0D2Z5_9BACT|nr:hypothetical protein [Algoriphagus antarcticus]REG76897.1 hypothetical protein C8N25_1523 [Algoriphagus antarcticus]
MAPQVAIVHATPKHSDSEDPTQNEVGTGQITQIRQTFSYDKTSNGESKRTGTDVVTKTFQTSSKQATTTVVTSLKIDSDGKISSTAKQFAFTSSGTGENHTFYMTEVQDVSIDQIGNDLVEVANSVSDYKIANGGDSQLQTKADMLNAGIGVASSIGVAFATAGLSMQYQIGAGIATGFATSKVASPEGLSITHKFEKSPNR